MRSRQIGKPSLALLLAVGLVLKILVSADSFAYAAETTPASRKQDFPKALDIAVSAIKQDYPNSLDIERIALVETPLDSSPEEPASSQFSLVGFFRDFFSGQSASVLDSLYDVFNPSTSSQEPVVVKEAVPVPSLPKQSPTKTSSELFTLPKSAPPQKTSSGSVGSTSIIGSDSITRTEVDERINSINNTLSLQIAALSLAGKSQPASAYASIGTASITSIPVYSFANLNASSNQNLTGNTFSSATISSSTITGSALGATTLTASGATTLSSTLALTGAATFSSTLSAGTTTLANLIVSGTATSTFAGAVCAPYFKGDGSQLTGISATPLSLNGLSGLTQTFASTSSGTDFAITSSGSVHTFNLPSASATARGLVTTGTQTLAGAKTFSSSLAIMGTLSLANTSTNGIVIGNITGDSRGVCSVDVQAMRSATSQIAQGVYSAAFGTFNTASGTFSSALGSCNTASGYGSLALGFCSSASGCFSSALGFCNSVSGHCSSAMGSCNTASGYRSSAMGQINTASCERSTAVGYINTSSGNCSSAMGYTNTASCHGTSAIGYFNTASSNYSSAVGYTNTASCYRTSAVGYCNAATGCNSSAFGYCNTAQGCCSAAFGYINLACGCSSSAIGFCNTASGYCSSSAVGYFNTATGNCSSAMGQQNTSNNTLTNSFGSLNSICNAVIDGAGAVTYADLGGGAVACVATAGVASTMIGIANNATGLKSSAVGYQNTASIYSSAFGYCNSASGCCSFAGGYTNSASGCNGTALGSCGNAAGTASSALGYQNTSFGECASSFGYGNFGCGLLSSAVGASNLACCDYSSAFGFQNCTSGCKSSAFGYGNATCGSESTVLGFGAGDNACGCSTTIGYQSAFLRVHADCSIATAISGACLSSGGVWTDASDRNIKENFTALDSQDVLAKINTLPITKWNYKIQDDSVTHIGAVAQDFYAAFQLGGSDKSIAALDTGGVALLGIQALTSNISNLSSSTTAAISGLTARIDQLATFSSTGDGGSSLFQTLQAFGASIVDGVVHFGEVVVDKMFASHLVIKNSADISKTGYTIYDRATLQPICVYFENGVQKTSSGECEEESAPAPEQIIQGVGNPTPDAPASGGDAPTTPEGSEEPVPQSSGGESVETETPPSQGEPESSPVITETPPVEPPPAETPTPVEPSSTDTPPVETPPPVEPPPSIE